jgi:uncharacterized membrane protein (DUF106 family)
MSVINSLFNTIFDGFFALTGLLGGNVAMWIFSAIAGVVFLLVFKWTSDQKAIKRVKDRIAAGFLAVRLYKDDFGQVWKANSSIFVNAFKYMGNALRPLLFIMVPAILMLIQLNGWYGYQPLKPDLEYRVLTPLLTEAGMELTNPIVGKTSTVVTAKIADSVDMSKAKISLQTEEGLRLVTPAVRAPEQREVSWRLQALTPGEHNLTISVNDAEIEHVVYVGEPEKFRKISAVRGKSLWTQLWHPTSPPIPGDIPVEEISVVYPEAEFNLLGLEMHWVIAFFILSLVFGFALKGVFGVEI